MEYILEESSIRTVLNLGAIWVMVLIPTRVFLDTFLFVYSKCNSFHFSNKMCKVGLTFQNAVVIWSVFDSVKGRILNLKQTQHIGTKE